jgi:hypothetical protein
VRLKSKLEVLKIRNKKFKEIQKRRDNEKEQFLAKFEELSKVFNASSSPSYISKTFNNMLMQKQSQENFVSIYPNLLVQWSS